MKIIDCWCFVKFQCMKWVTFVQVEAPLGQENLLRIVRWIRWHCPPDTGLAIRPLAEFEHAISRSRMFLIILKLHEWAIIFCILWNWMTLTSFVFIELANTMKYGWGILYNLVFITCVSHNFFKTWTPRRRTNPQAPASQAAAFINCTRSLDLNAPAITVTVAVRT